MILPEYDMNGVFELLKPTVDGLAGKLGCTVDDVPLLFFRGGHPFTRKYDADMSTWGHLESVLIMYGRRMGVDRFKFDENTGLGAVGFAPGTASPQVYVLGSRIQTQDWLYYPLVVAYYLQPNGSKAHHKPEDI